jgi:hypothetical protein
VAWALSNKRRAHKNSVARIANPNGITTTAGPGRITIATPMNKTVKPSVATTPRLSQASLGMSAVSDLKFAKSLLIATNMTVASAGSIPRTIICNTHTCMRAAITP